MSKGIQIHFPGKARKPWLGVCSYSCFHALRDKCVCRCGGRYHGLGVKRSEESLDRASANAQLYWDLIKTKRCAWCGGSLEGELIRHYPHSGGWPVKGFKKKQWLYIVCPNCQYQWALWKLGVSRDAEI